MTSTITQFLNQNYLLVLSLFSVTFHIFSISLILKPYFLWGVGGSVQQISVTFCQICPTGKYSFSHKLEGGVFARVWLSIKCFPKAVGITYILQLLPEKNSCPMKSGKEMYSLTFLERHVFLSGLLSLLSCYLENRNILSFTRWNTNLLCLDTLAWSVVLYTFFLFKYRMKNGAQWQRCGISFRCG